MATYHSKEAIAQRLKALGDFTLVIKPTASSPSEMYQIIGPNWADTSLLTGRDVADMLEGDCLEVGDMIRWPDGQLAVWIGSHLVKHEKGEK